MNDPFQIPESHPPFERAHGQVSRLHQLHSVSKSTQPHPKRQLHYSEYTVAWICALPKTELVAAKLMLDERQILPHLENEDNNTYTCGSINRHNVVIACLPPSVPGNVSASQLIQPLRTSFPNIRMTLLVGIGGGVPYDPPLEDPTKDIHLGDVVVGWPEDGGQAVVQYDFGRQHTGGRSEITGLIDKPERKLLTTLGDLLANHEIGETHFADHLERCRTRKNITYPGLAKDMLYEADYAHEGARGSCASCDSAKLVTRPVRESGKFVFHQGRIATGNSVMMDGVMRDKISQDCKGARCFEMEAAGVLGTERCLVIRGISDYADSHKNDEWKLYAAATAAAFAREFLYTIPPGIVSSRDGGMGITAIQRTAVAEAICTLPAYLSNDETFKGRDDVLAELGRCLQDRNRVSLSGLGGMGKTQIAVEFARRFCKDFPDSHIFWVHAANSDSFDESYRVIAEELRLPGQNKAEFDTRRSVQKWLNDKVEKPWLMILDNADEYSLFFPPPKGPLGESERKKYLASYLPRGNGRMIITTRNRKLGRDLADGSDPIPIQPLSSVDAQSLLFAKITKRKMLDEQAAQRLLELLGYIPLAITQAAAYINWWDDFSVSDYLDAFNKYHLDHSDYSSIKEILSEDLQDFHRPDTPNSIFKTWKISYEQIRRENPHAANLLSLMAVLDTQAIPEELLQESDKIKRREDRSAIQTLRDFSLIRYAARSYSMHVLVQLSMQDWLRSQESLRKWQEEGVNILARKFPHYSELDDHSKLCAVLLPQAQAVLQYHSKDESMRAELLRNVAEYERGRGRYHDAHEHATKAYKIHQRLYGDRHEETLSSLYVCARILRSLGRYSEAKEKHKQCLTGRKELLGAGHIDTLFSLGELARVLASKGKYERAEEMQREDVRGREKVLGEDHPDTLKGLTYLAITLRKRKKYEEAEEVFRRVLKGYEKRLGKDHAFTLTSQSNLAEVLTQRGQLAIAQEMHQQALDKKEVEFGKEHPFTLRSYAGLAEVWRLQKRYEEAETMHLRALKEREKYLGEEHPGTLYSRHNLAVTLYERKKYEDALAMMRQAVEARERVLGGTHPLTRETSETYTRWLEEVQERQRKALKLKAPLEGRRSSGVLARRGSASF